MEQFIEKEIRKTPREHIDRVCYNIQERHLKKVSRTCIKNGRRFRMKAEPPLCSMIPEISAHPGFVSADTALLPNR